MNVVTKKETEGSKNNLQIVSVMHKAATFTLPLPLKQLPFQVTVSGKPPCWITAMTLK